MNGTKLANTLIYATAFCLALTGLGQSAALSSAATDLIAARDARQADALSPTHPRSQETLHGMIADIDERNDRITVRFAGDVSAGFRVQDGLLFNAVRYGDPVEITVEMIDGAKTIVGLRRE